jgi:hypothetical protein
MNGYGPYGVTHIALLKYDLRTWRLNINYFDLIFKCDKIYDN